MSEQLFVTSMTSSFVMLVMSVLCITLSTFLIVEGFYCHCLGISLLLWFQEKSKSFGQKYLVIFLIS